MVAVTTTPEIGELSPKPHPSPPGETLVLMAAVTTTPETGHLSQNQPPEPRPASRSLQPVSREGEPRLPSQYGSGEVHTFSSASGQGEMLCNFAQDPPFPGTLPPGKGPAEASNEAFRGQSGPVAPDLNLCPVNTLSEGRDSRKIFPSSSGELRSSTPAATADPAGPAAARVDAANLSARSKVAWLSRCFGFLPQILVATHGPLPCYVCHPLQTDEPFVANLTARFVASKHFMIIF